MDLDMRNFQRWMKEHPRKRFDGLLKFCGRSLTHEEVKIVVDYAVKKGYPTVKDFPNEEVAKLLEGEK